MRHVLLAAVLVAATPAHAQDTDVDTAAGTLLGALCACQRAVADGDFQKYRAATESRLTRYFGSRDLAVLSVKVKMAQVRDRAPPHNPEVDQFCRAQLDQAGRKFDVAIKAIKN